MNKPYKKPEARPKISTCIRNVQIQIVNNRVFLTYPNPTKDTVVHLETQIISCYETFWSSLI